MEKRFTALETRGLEFRSSDDLFEVIKIDLVDTLVDSDSDSSSSVISRSESSYTIPDLKDIIMSLEEPKDKKDSSISSLDDLVYLKKVGVVDTDGLIRSSDSMFEVVRVEGIGLLNAEFDEFSEDDEQFDYSRLDFSWIEELSSEELIKEYRKLRCLAINNTFPVPELHTYYPFNNEIQAILRANKVTVVRGTFTFKEDKILHQNMRDFCQEYHIRSPHTLLAIQEKPFLVPPLLKPTLRLKLGQYLGQNLPHRNIGALLHRATTIFHPFKSNLFEPELDTKLAELVKRSQYGVNWDQVSTLLKRTPKACCRRWCYIRQHQLSEAEWVKGNWSQEEVNRLMCTVASLTNTENPFELSTSLIPWTKVGELMRTRNPTQCLIHWNRMANRKLQPSEEVLLYKKVKKKKPNNVFDVDWYDLSSKYFPGVSATSLSHKFIKLLMDVSNAKRRKEMDFQAALVLLGEHLEVSRKLGDIEQG